VTLFFLHSTVIGQILTLTASSILLLLIVDDASYFHLGKLHDSAKSYMIVQFTWNFSLFTFLP